MADVAARLAAARPGRVAVGRDAVEALRVLRRVDPDHRVGGLHQGGVQPMLARQVVHLGGAEHRALVPAADGEPGDVGALRTGVRRERLDQWRGDGRRLDHDAVPGCETQHPPADEAGEAVRSRIGHRAKAASTASSRRSEPNRTGSSTTRPVSAAAASIAARASAADRWRVLSAIAPTRAGRTGAVAAS